MRGTKEGRVLVRVAADGVHVRLRQHPRRQLVVRVRQRARPHDHAAQRPQRPAHALLVRHRRRPANHPALSPPLDFDFTKFSSKSSGGFGFGFSFHPDRDRDVVGCIVGLEVPGRRVLRVPDRDWASLHRDWPDWKWDWDWDWAWAWEWGGGRGRGFIVVDGLVVAVHVQPGPRGVLLSAHPRGPVLPKGNDATVCYCRTQLTKPQRDSSHRKQQRWILIEISGPLTDKQVQKIQRSENVIPNTVRRTLVLTCPNQNSAYDKL